MEQNFMRGSIVRILSANKYNYRKGRYEHEKDLVGNIGTVIATGPDYITVEVNGMRNPTSQTGFYFFDRDELQKVSHQCCDSENVYKGDENQMHEKYKDCLNVAEVYLRKDPSTILLCANYSCDLSVGDCVIVVGTRDNMWVTVVSDIHEMTSTVAVENARIIDSEVVCICDMTEYNERRQLRELEAKKAAERKKLLSQMAARAEKVDQMHRFRILAEHDEEMSELLRQLDELENPGESHGTEEA